ncbi:MAG: hypothetical protein SGJ27_09525 [Candidatus Melainabacteria bacterium]|nr:hypothetical protein [Candidatus Melainabacteria bacterium]
MEYLVALGCVVVLTIFASMILSRLHPASSSMDFESIDAYTEHLTKRDRFVREEQILFAGFNTALGVAIGTGFSAAALPALTLVVGISAAWSVYRLLKRRDDQMLLWDKVDMKFLGISLLVGIAVAVATALLIALPVSVASLPVFIYAVAWLLLFPL